MESFANLNEYKYHTDEQNKIGTDNLTRINNNANIELREKIENLFKSENSESLRIESINSIKNHKFSNSFEEISQIEDSNVLNLLVDLIHDNNEHISQSAFNAVIQIASISEDYALLIFERGICPICRKLISQREKLIDVLALLNNISSYGGVFSRRAYQILPFNSISGLISEISNLSLLARYILNTMKSFRTDKFFMKQAFSFLFDIIQKKDIDSTCLILCILRKMAKDEQLTGFKQNINEISGFVIKQVKNGISCSKVIYQSLLFIGYMVKKRLIDGIDFDLFKIILNYHKSSDIQVIKACLWCVNEFVINKSVVVDSNFLSDFLVKNQSVITLSPYEIKREYCLFIVTTILQLPTESDLHNLSSKINLNDVLTAFIDTDDTEIVKSLLDVLQRWLESEKRNNPKIDLKTHISEDLYHFIEDIANKDDNITNYTSLSLLDMINDVK